MSFLKKSLLRRSSRRAPLAISLAFAIIWSAACSGPTDTDEPDSEPDTQACVAPASWFPQSQTPEPDPNQPFEDQCDFHQWSWQAFLWLTQDVGGEARFETFPTVADVISGEDTSAEGGLMKLSVRVEKGDSPPEPLDEVNQAGSGGVMVGHGGRALYYSQYVNPQMFQDIVGNRWNDPEVLNAIPPDTEFEIGDIELKAVWNIVDPDADESTFFTRSALVDRLITTASGGIAIDPYSPPLEVTVALVGLHVVGWVEGHPEAIWATFEQNDNAPDFAPSQDPSAPVSDRDWTFYTANTVALDCNQFNTVTLDESTQILNPVAQACRQYPYGMVAGSTEPGDVTNLAAITSLNDSVWEQLAADNVWQNYFEVGAIWTNGVIQPNDTLQDHRLGSTLLSNATIETFTQSVSAENNCFSCHNTMMYNPTDPTIPPLQGTNINLSHIILEAYLANQPSASDSDQGGNS